MRTCDHDGCGWRAIAPSASAAADRYARHLIEEHGEEVDVDIPAGKVEVRTSGDDAWRTVTLEEAKRLHESTHEDGPSGRN